MKIDKIGANILAEGAARRLEYSTQELKYINDRKNKYLSMTSVAPDQRLSDIQKLIGTVAIESFNAYIPQIHELYDIVPIKNASKYPFDKRILSFDITHWIYEKGSDLYSRLANVYNSIRWCECNIALIYSRYVDSCRLTMAITNKSDNEDPGLVDQYAECLMESIRGNFPGTKMNKSITNVPSDLFKDSQSMNLAVISGLVSGKTESFNEQTIEKLLEGCIPQNVDEEYSIVLLAEPMNYIDDEKNHVADMYSALKPFAEWQTNDSYTEGSGISATSTLTYFQSITLAGNLQYSAPTPGGVLGGGGTLAINFGKSISRSSSISEQASATKGLTINHSNYNVVHTLEMLNSLIKRLDEGTALGLWKFATYVFSKNVVKTKNVASLYSSLLQGKNSFLIRPSVNFWEFESETKQQAFDYLRMLEHPKFTLKRTLVDADEDWLLYPEYVDASCMITGIELSKAMNFPLKSIPGITVSSCASFGRNIVRQDMLDDENETLVVGNIYHMRNDDKLNVELDVNSLASHTFITGATGNGKSNAIYLMLDELLKKNDHVKFMVIEPAKGEYKNIFGNRDDVTVYGTNPKKTRILSINPFSFPEDVSVFEHIDRLVEIFNVCWPMYAAMPVILKNAIIKSYESRGWDLSNSCMKMATEKRFPNFSDVLCEIKRILDSSDFSAESKGDYTGALCTRVESLTFGEEGMCFSGDFIPDPDLFEKNTIIDISRVGNTEVKSLLMGLLVMKLQEYRMSQGLKHNSKLQHLTILEEAHNLIKRTSTEQSSESSNILGKSVEMITNSIAEMRTYGEGFIIADQAPGLLDPAVIRNTNTKIIYKLPSYEDRIIAGKSIGLNEDQVDELARLEKGVAAVYQNNWLEAVLCHFKKSELKESDYNSNGQSAIITNSERKKYILQYLLSGVEKADGIHSEKEKQIVKKYINDCMFSANIEREIIEAVDKEKYDDLDDISEIVCKLYQNCSILTSPDASDINEWNSTIIANIDPGIMELDKRYQELFVQCILVEQSKGNVDIGRIANNWISIMNSRGGIS